MLEAAHEPPVRFWRLIETAPPPVRADRAAGGTLPTRAFRYCEAVTTASAFGWLVFPALDISLVWDGSEIRWTWEGAQGWHPLGICQYPGFRERFDTAAPEAVRGYAPPFIGALHEPGLVNLWSGLFARSRPGWSLLLRPPANLPRAPGYEIYEGMLEADRWFGPLFVNLRLTRTQKPVRFRRDTPLFQVQPVPREAYDEALLNAFSTTEGVAGFGAAEWAAFERSIVAPRRDGRCPIGQEAIRIRRRRRTSAA
jgi:hypothetical protein